MIKKYCKLKIEIKNRNENDDDDDNDNDNENENENRNVSSIVNEVIRTILFFYEKIL